MDEKDKKEELKKEEVEKETKQEEVEKVAQINEQEENKNDNNEKQNNNEENEKIKKEGFFKKAWNSITKIEKYPEMAAQGIGKAFSYICKVVAILAIVVCLGMMYQAYQMVQEGIQYLQNEFPEFSYKDGILTIQSEEPITI